LFVVFKKDMNTEHGLTTAPTHYGKQGRQGLRFELRLTAISCLATILGVVHAAHSEQPLLWLAIWPAPLALACTIFTFFRHGFHFEDGVLVLGRQGDSTSYVA
jgi:hypothetical protein